MRALDFKQMMSIDSDKIEEYESDAILKTYLRKKAQSSYYINNLSNDNPTFFWTSSPDHRFIFFVALASRFNVAPKRLQIHKDGFVIFSKIEKHLRCHSDTAKIIIEEAIHRKELLLIKPSRKDKIRSICFTASDKMIRNLEKILPYVRIN